MLYSPLLPTALRAAEQACQEIIEVYNSGNFGAELKGDNSPLTLADKKAHLAITAILQSSNLPILQSSNLPISQSPSHLQLQSIIRKHHIRGQFPGNISM